MDKRQLAAVERLIEKARKAGWFDEPMTPNSWTMLKAAMDEIERLETRITTLEGRREGP